MLHYQCSPARKANFESDFFERAFFCYSCVTRFYELEIILFPAKNYLLRVVSSRESLGDTLLEKLKSFWIDWRWHVAEWHFHKWHFLYYAFHFHRDIGSWVKSLPVHLIGSGSMQAVMFRRTSYEEEIVLEENVWEKRNLDVRIACIIYTV